MRIYNNNQIVEFSSKFKLIENQIKLFLKYKMYNNKNVLIKNNKGKKIVKSLFKIINKKPKYFINKSQLFRDDFDSLHYKILEIVNSIK